MKDTYARHRTIKGMCLSERIRFAMNDLWKRRLMTFFNLAGVVIAIVCGLVQSFYGLSIYQYQHSVIDESLPTLIVATCPDATDERFRFTNEKIAEIMALPKVKLAFPKMELNVKVWSDPSFSLDVTIEGTIPKDPALTPSRLIWGRPVSGLSAREIVVPMSLFDKLGGRITPSGPSPSRLHVQVGRTVSGHDESHTMPLEVVGLIGHQDGDKVFAPLELVHDLDKWCKNRVRRVGGTGQDTERDYPFCRAYVPIEQRSRLEEEAKQLHIDLEPQVEVTSYNGPVAKEAFLEFKVTDSDRAGGRVDENLVRVLSMTKPTFTAVIPAVTVEADLNGKILLEGSSPADPGRFAASLRHGSWLTGESRNEIVLASASAIGLAASTELADRIGRVVEVRFHREGKTGASEETLTMALKIVGISERDNGFAPVALLRDIALWQKRKLIFNESRMVFESPVAIDARRGHVRCNVHADDAGSVEAIVKLLGQWGYGTEDSLADQQGLRRLGQALVIVVGAFAIAVLAVAMMMIAVTTTMNVLTKRWEIGILKAHGMTTQSILSIFAIQGAAVGLSAFVIGSGLVIVIEPPVRTWLGASFKMPLDAIVPRALWSFPFAWLLVGAFAVALLLSVLSATLPAMRATQLLPVELLQRRE